MSIATDLIDIFRNSSFPCGSRLVSFSWFILSSISLRKIVRSFMLLIKVVSILVIIVRLFICFCEVNFTTTAEWSDEVRDQSVLVLLCLSSRLSDHRILSSLDIFSPCLHVIELSNLLQQSFRLNSLNISVMFSATVSSHLVLFVLILSDDQKVVLKSPSIIISQLS